MIPLAGSLLQMSAPSALKMRSRAFEAYIRGPVAAVSAAFGTVDAYRYGIEHKAAIVDFPEVTDSFVNEFGVIEQGSATVQVAGPAQPTMTALVAPLFNADLLTTMVPGSGAGAATFARATSATVDDFEGNVRFAIAGELRFKGARRVCNLISGPTQTNYAAWTVLNCTLMASNEVAPDNTNTAARIREDNAVAGTLRFHANANDNGRNFATGNRVVISMYYKGKTAGSIGKTVKFWLFDGGANNQSNTVTFTANWLRQMLTAGNLAGTTSDLRVGTLEGGNLPTNDEFYQWGAMAEDVSGQANQNASEYVSSGALAAPYHGAGVDGVKYFSYLNGNTVAANVLTEQAGAAIADATLKGALLEEARTNSFLNSGAPANTTRRRSASAPTSCGWLVPARSRSPRARRSVPDSASRRRAPPSSSTSRAAAQLRSRSRERSPARSAKTARTRRATSPRPGRRSRATRIFSRTS
jgi:hypothetical protein